MLKRIEEVPKRVKWYYQNKFILPLVVFCVSLCVISFSVLLLPKWFFDMPGPSSEFDCDDSTLVMFERFTNLGIRVTPFLGNLRMEGETYMESDHIWLIADIAGLPISFDWGEPRMDRQHYEGFEITYEKLVAFVEQDRISNQAPAN